MPIVPLPQTGGCLCGAVRYALGGAPLLAYACHCHDCQSRSGSAFTLSLVVPSEHVSIEGPVELVFRPTRSGREIDHRYCARCRTPMAARARAAPDFMTLRAGTLDDAGWVVPVAQTWVESAIPWAVIPGVRQVPWAEFDFTELGREWVAGAPQFRAGPVPGQP